MALQNLYHIISCKEITFTLTKIHNNSNNIKCNKKKGKQMKKSKRDYGRNQRTGNAVKNMARPSACLRIVRRPTLYSQHATVCTLLRVNNR